jgi:hypothetical protein
MLRKRQIAVIALVGLFLLLLGLSWVCGRRASTQPIIKAEDGNVSPLFVAITRPGLVPNVNPNTGKRVPGMHYAHRFYYRSDRLQPVSAPSYWVRDWVNSALYPLGFRGIAPRQMVEQPSGTGTSMLWFAYGATNDMSLNGACLVSEQGLRLPLTSITRQVLTDRSPPGHLDCWEIPSLLTHHGKYRLVVPSLTRPLVTFVND